MVAFAASRVSEALNSLLRTDYISLNDTEKLELLAGYYVDYFNLLPEVLTDTDQLVVGRRGTGKTTLLYRALVACNQSWSRGYDDSEAPRARTLGIYIDLSKCQSLESSESEGFEYFEHAFVSEICDAINEQLPRFWPALASEPGRFAQLFRAAESRQVVEVRDLLDRIGKLLREGVPRFVIKSSPVKQKERSQSGSRTDASLSGSISPSDLGIDAKLGTRREESVSTERESSTRIVYRLNVSDILRLLSELREKAGLAATYIFIDEFSALTPDLQRRFTTLLRKLLGSHCGVYIKLCAITDKYTLGSALILQRDLFEVSLDLDAFVERSNNLSDAMDGLRDFSQSIVSSRLAAYGCPEATELFESPDDAWTELSRSAMGVPRTLGIVLKQAWQRSQQGTRSGKIQKSDIEYGITYASTAYLNQLIGAARDGLAVPGFHADIWHAILSRAQAERAKVAQQPASHFLVLPRHEQVLSVLNMFFLVHLLTKSRTTKKERTVRSLYCLDYGICRQNNLGFSMDKNVLRQQRFAYDSVLVPFETYFGMGAEESFRCPTCGSVYSESDLVVAGIRLTFCPRDRADLVAVSGHAASADFTEEETKIIGSIRSSGRADRVIARQIADDVGCYVQKVAKFGEKLERLGVASREQDAQQDRLIYYGTAEKPSQ